MVACVRGLSPRTRGNRSHRPGARCVGGPIPADAGEPGRGLRPACPTGAYPRGRGGTGAASEYRDDKRGLSPRTRGNRRRLLVAPCPRGPIPADAGEPSRCIPARRATRAYPRGRGGAQPVASLAMFGPGLSPRTRGNPRPSPSSATRSGPIPADAGEPHSLPHGQTPNGAYPRGRGGTNVLGLIGLGQAGLSPRTRGNPRRVPYRSRLLGPIPADAGEPRPKQSPAVAPGAYPRGRGGTMRQLASVDLAEGLSPRTRGNLTVSGTAANAEGPIPADAGEPMAERTAPRCNSAYPRGRGGTGSSDDRLSVARGLSPRTRGNLVDIQHAGPAPGPIPADAGEPPVPRSTASWRRAYPRGRGGTLTR